MFHFEWAKQSLSLFIAIYCFTILTCFKIKLTKQILQLLRGRKHMIKMLILIQLNCQVFKFQSKRSILSFKVVKFAECLLKTSALVEGFLNKITCDLIKNYFLNLILLV